MSDPRPSGRGSFWSDSDTLPHALLAGGGLVQHQATSAADDRAVDLALHGELLY